VHKGKSYPGEHAAIIPQALWNQVHEIMATNPHMRAGLARNRSPALLTAGMLAAAQPIGLGHAILLAMLLASTAGLLMLALAATGWARLTALVPSPVTQGLGNAIALLVVVSQLPLLLGTGPGAAVPWQAPLPGALMVAALALLLMLRPLPGLPAPLLALGAATVLHLLLSQFGVATGPVVGAMPDLETLGACLRIP
jgi:MFS superfamily sulfate permease-like transporter